MKPSRRTIWNELVGCGPRVQVRIFLIVFAVTVILTVERLITNRVNPLWALLGLLIGMVIGVILARTKPLRWDDTNREVASSNSVLGLIAIVLYLIFVFNRSDIIDTWIRDAGIVGVVGMAITSGVMLGRAWITFRGIRNVLRTAALTPGNEP